MSAEEKTLARQFLEEVEFQANEVVLKFPQYKDVVFYVEHDARGKFTSMSLRIMKTEEGQEVKRKFPDSKTRAER